MLLQILLLTFNDANVYDFDFDVFERPDGETDQVYFARFAITPVSGIDVILVTDVQRNTPSAGQTRITVQPPVNVDFTLTYPPANLRCCYWCYYKRLLKKRVGYMMVQLTYQDLLMILTVLYQTQTFMCT